MTTEAQAVADWASNNGLLLNHAKTKVMILDNELYLSTLDLENLPPHLYRWPSATLCHGSKEPRCQLLSNTKLESACEECVA